MFDRAINLLRRHVKKRRESKALAAIAAAPVEPASLRSIGQRELDEVFRQPVADAEWPEVAAEIARIIEIEDLKTGGVNPGDRRALYYLVRSLRPRRVLEIGTHVGASTINIAAAMKRNGNLGESALVTVDLDEVNDAPDAFWRRANLSRSPRDAIATLGMGDRVRFVARNSFRYFDETEDRFDLIFLDGDHAAATVYQEIPRALRCLRDGGVVLLHDFFPGLKPLWSNGSVIAGPQLAVERLQREGAKIVVRPFGALPWPTKLGSNVTSLAVLCRP